MSAKQPPRESPLLTMKQVQALCATHGTTFQRLTVPGIKIGASCRFRKQDVEEALGLRAPAKDEWEGILSMSAKDLPKFVAAQTSLPKEEHQPARSPLLTPKQVADWFQVATSTVMRLPIAKRRIGRMWRFHEDDVLHYLRGRTHYPSGTAPRRTPKVSPKRGRPAGSGLPSWAEIKKRIDARDGGKPPLK